MAWVVDHFKELVSQLLFFKLFNLKLLLSYPMLNCLFANHAYIDSYNLPSHNVPKRVIFVYHIHYIDFLH